jgi:hypothetical protein
MAVTKGSDNEFPSVLFAEQGSDPATPAAGTQRLFVDSADGLLKLIDDTGTVTAIDSGFANPMTTSGDVIYGGASGAPTRLAKSTDGKVLTLASGIPSWVTPSTGFSDPMTTRGDIIIRNASNVTDRLGRGSSGKVLTSDGTDISWQTPSAAASSLLATKTDTSNRTYTNTTTLAAIDTTNLRCTAVVPASGNVLVRLTASHTVNSSSTVSDQFVEWGVRIGSTNYPGSTGPIIFRAVYGSATVQYVTSSVAFVLTGLTPGSTNFDWAALTSAGQSAVLAGYSLMEVWAA